MILQARNTTRRPQAIECSCVEFTGCRKPRHIGSLVAILLLMVTGALRNVAIVVDVFAKCGDGQTTTGQHVMLYSFGGFENVCDHLVHECQNTSRISATTRLQRQDMFDRKVFGSTNHRQFTSYKFSDIQPCLLYPSIEL